MDELIAALASGSILLQNPIHGSSRAKILAFIEQGRMDGCRRAVLEALGIQQAPSRQQGGVQALPTEKGSHPAGTFGSVGIGQNTLFVCSGETAALGLSDDLGVGAGRGGGAGFAVGGTPVTLATLGLPPSHRRQNRWRGGGAKMIVHVVHKRILLALHCN
jgi:hypothetical protein